MTLFVFEDVPLLGKCFSPVVKSTSFLLEREHLLLPPWPGEASTSGSRPGCSVLSRGSKGERLLFPRGGHELLRGNWGTDARVGSGPATQGHAGRRQHRAVASPARADRLPRAVPARRRVFVCNRVTLVSGTTPGRGWAVVSATIILLWWTFGVKTFWMLFRRVLDTPGSSEVMVLLEVGKEESLVVYKGACRRVSFENTFQNVSQNTHSRWRRGWSGKGGWHVCVPNTQKKLQSLQLKASVSFRSPGKGQR